MPADELLDPGASGQLRTPRGSGTPEDSDQYMRIEQVAVRTGLTKRTLRYYEEIGLLAPPSRTEGGYRLYSAEDITRLERIKRLRDLLGFSLAEIREIASIEEQREQVRATWKQATDPATRLASLERADQLLRGQMRLIEEKLTGLQDMRERLHEQLTNIERHAAEIRADLAAGTPSAPKTPDS